MMLVPALLTAALAWLALALPLALLAGRRRRAAPRGPAPTSTLPSGVSRQTNRTARVRGRT